MDCSALWTRRFEAFREAFSLVPEYLRVGEDVVSLNEVSIPLGRRFRALSSGPSSRCLGREGLQAMIREHVRLAELFEGWVRDEPGWELTAPRRFSLVCFRREEGDEENEALLARVNATGELFLSHTRLGGRYGLRLAIGNARTTEDDVRACVGRAPARGRLASLGRGDPQPALGDDSSRPSPAGPASGTTGSSPTRATGPGRDRGRGVRVWPPGRAGAGRRSSGDRGGTCSASPRAARSTGS